MALLLCRALGESGQLDGLAQLDAVVEGRLPALLGEGSPLLGVPHLGGQVVEVRLRDLPWVVEGAVLDLVDDDVRGEPKEWYNGKFGESDWSLKHTSKPIHNSCIK